MEGMSCRLLLLDVRGPTLLLADRSGPRNGSMLLLVDSAGATAADRDEANRIRFCTAAVAGAVEKIESSEPRSSVRAAYAPTPSPVPGDIRTFELNVQIVLEHVDRVRSAEQAYRLQTRIREIAMRWANGAFVDDEESALLDEIYNTDAEIQRLAGVAGQHLALAAGGPAVALTRTRTTDQRERADADADDAAVAAFEALREREAQGEHDESASSSSSHQAESSGRVIRPRWSASALRGRGRVIGPIPVSLSDSSEDGG